MMHRNVVINTRSPYGEIGDFPSLWYRRKEGRKERTGGPSLFSLCVCVCVKKERTKKRRQMQLPKSMEQSSRYSTFHLTPKLPCSHTSTQHTDTLSHKHTHTKIHTRITTQRIQRGPSLFSLPPPLSYQIINLL